jgi:hypothetical protein
MAVPSVTNDSGRFEYLPDIGRWICRAGKIPGGGSGDQMNCLVHTKYGKELTVAAFAAGFIREDFIIPSAKKAKSAKVGRPVSAKRENLFFDFTKSLR